MRTSSRNILFCLFVFLYSSALLMHAQSNSGSLAGVVTDPSGAVIPGASVTIQNPVSATAERQRATGRAISDSRMCPSIPITSQSQNKGSVPSLKT